MLRDYQKDMIKNIHTGWSSCNNVLSVLPTGAGKTFTFSSLIKDVMVPTMVTAHRNELVGQMSVSLGQLGVPHRLIVSDTAYAQIAQAHRITLGRVMLDASSPICVSSVDTIIRRVDHSLFNRIKLWVVDEAHHVIEGNKWGQFVNFFPNARGLGVTATPERADGKGLGRGSDGVFDKLVVGPTGDELIDWGYLSPYRFLTPHVSDLDLSAVEVGSTGDFKKGQLVTATKKSTKLVGSASDTYVKHAFGKRAITFCVDIEHCHQTAESYHRAGVSAAVLSSKTPFLERVATIEKFKQGEIMQLVNVDLFSEGFDVPAVDMVVMLRKTSSFPVFSQQSGRAFRPIYAEGYDLSTAQGRKAAIAAGPKPYAIISDHVGNVLNPKFLLPTMSRSYSLSARPKRSNSNTVPEDAKLTSCRNEGCFRPFKAILVKCPYCGWQPIPSESTPRSANIKEIDGDLEFLDLDVIRGLQSEAAKVVGPAHAPRGLSRVAQLAVLKRHKERSEAQVQLRSNISQWAGYRVSEGLEIREAQKLFYLRFGVDVLTAQTLSASDAKSLTQKVEDDYEKRS